MLQEEPRMTDRPEPTASNGDTPKQKQTNRQQIGEHDHRTSVDKAAADAETDHEVELMTQTIQPYSDAPSRSGITGSGSGADGER